MPQVIALPIAYLGAIIFNAGLATSVSTALFAAQVLVYGGLAAAAYAASVLLAPKIPNFEPSVPKAEDGSYNLKQSVPSRTYVLGTVKKSSDYLDLLEANGWAYHVMCWASHEIDGYVQHYLHDDAVTLDSGGWVRDPAHFTILGLDLVNIVTRNGLSLETAYANLTAVFSPYWTADHRGDGLATVCLSCRTVSQEDYLKVYPNQMPQHTAVGNGAKLYDPRTGTTAFSKNLALMRLWHLTHPVGGKMTLSDMHLPDWIAAANVCDQDVTNRDGGTEKRYHGGFWFRAATDPRQVGLTIDQAAELVVYETAEGKIGVHAGQYVEPTVTLTANDVVQFSLDVNQRQESTVLAVRGQWTDPANLYSTVDAAIYGDPYVSEDATERTKTIANAAVQSHNHCQRLQKLAYSRANAARVSLTAHYEAAEDVLESRFVRVNIPPKLNNVVVEITTAPTISLRQMQISFSGIIVPETLYSFNAAIEEGAPGAPITRPTRGGVPEPEGFAVEIQTEVVTGGDTAAFAVASWDEVSDALTYELEWQPSDASQPARSVTSRSQETELRSASLADGIEYRFRLRAWSVNVPSDWTDYQYLVATADPTPPSAVTDVAATGGSGTIEFEWIAPNSANYRGSRLYLNATNTMVGASLIATEYGAPSASDVRTVSAAIGAYYGFVVAINGSGVEATPVATGSITVT